MRYDDQVHLNRFYAHIYAAQNELAQVLEKDNILARVQRTVYVLEDTAREYVAAPKKRRVKNGV